MQHLMFSSCILYLYTFYFKFTHIILHLYQDIVKRAQENDLCEVHSAALLFPSVSNLLAKTYNLLEFPETRNNFIYNTLARKREFPKNQCILHYPVLKGTNEFLA